MAVVRGQTEAEHVLHALSRRVAGPDALRAAWAGLGDDKAAQAGFMRRIQKALEVAAPAA